MLGSERLVELLKSKKTWAEEQRELAAAQEEKMHREFGEGIQLHAESRKLKREIGLADPTSYSKYVWLKAAGGEDLEMRAEAVKIIYRNKISSAAINFDLTTARRYLDLERLIADADEPSLVQARITAQQKMDAAEAAHKQSIKDYNAVYQAAKAVSENKTAYGRIRIDNPRLFATADELDDFDTIRYHYVASNLPL